MEVGTLVDGGFFERVDEGGFAAVGDADDHHGRDVDMLMGFDDGLVTRSDELKSMEINEKTLRWQFEKRNAVRDRKRQCSLLCFHVPNRTPESKQNT